MNPMEQIPVPSGLLSCFLLIPLCGQEARQKRAGIPHRGRSVTNTLRVLLIGFFISILTISAESIQEFPTSPPSADTLLYKVKSKTTGKEYTFKTSQNFLKGVPKDNKISILEAQEIALAYAKNYRGFRSADADTVTILECKSAHYGEVPFVCVFFSIIDKNKQMSSIEECIIIFGDRSHLTPSL